MNIKNGSVDRFPRHGSLNIQRSIVTNWEYSAGQYFPAACKDQWRRNIFALDEIVLATNGFSGENVIRIEDFDVDYFGNLVDGSKVIIKIFSANNRSVLF